MPISVDFNTLVIFVPRDFMTLVQSAPNEIFELNINDFRIALNEFQESEAGITALNTHNHNTTVDVGGVALARVVEIINGYTVTFENGQYAVNLVGANSNIADVTNVNEVSVRSANSAGLQQVTSGSGLSTEQDQRLSEVHQLFGLSGDQVTHSATSITSTGINIQITPDGQGGGLVERQ